MALKAYQCCYTNASKEVGGKTISGWQAVAVSPDIPQDAKEACIGYQSVNSVIQPGLASETGKTPDLYEVFGDGKYIYSVRTRYGLVDRLGRPNMFSHAYIIPCKDAIDDPSWFLSIPDGNYAENEDAASWDGSIGYGDPMNMDMAMSIAGLSENSLEMLVKAVYAQMSDKKLSKPLYVQSDGELATVKAVMFCLYSSLPFYLRRNLKFSSEPSNGDSKKNLVFSIHAKERDLHFEPATGENNILTPRIEKKIARYGYLTYPFKKLPASDRLAFFRDLDERSEKLTGFGKNSDLAAKIAFAFQQDPECAKLDDAGLEDLLIDLLQAEPSDSEMIGEYIKTIVCTADSRGAEISPETETMLSDWIADSNYAMLCKMKENRFFSRLCAKNTDDAVKTLRELPAEERRGYLIKLQGDEKGAEIVKRYFYEILSASQPTTWDEIRTAAQEYEPLRRDEEITSCFLEAAYRKYRLSFLGNSRAGDDLDAYTSILTSILPENEFQQKVLDAKALFWRLSGIENLSYREKSLFEKFAVSQFPDSPSEDNYNLAKRYIELLESYDPDKEKEFFAELEAFFDENRGIAGKDKERLLRDMQEYVVERHGENKGKNFVFWAVKVLNAATDEIREDLLCLKSAFETHDVERLTVACIKYIQRDNVAVEDKNSIISAVLQAYDKYDSEEKPVPLDCWLSIGKAIGNQNVFSVFDDRSPVILRLDPQTVVTGSSLLKNDYPDFDGITADAVEYVRQNRGRPAEAVWKWLKAAGVSGTEELENEWRQPARKASKNVPKVSGRHETSEEKPQGKGFFKSIFGRKG